MLKLKTSDAFDKIQGDILTIGETLTQGSNSVFVNGMGVTRTGDLVSCSFKVIGVSKNVFAE